MTSGGIHTHSGRHRRPWGAAAALGLGLVLVMRAAALTPEARLAAAARAGDYLVRGCDATGRFVYVVDPRTGAADSYNWLRHAGAVYALCRLYAETGAEPYAAAAERAAALLVRQVHEVEVDGRTFRVLVSAPATTRRGSSRARSVKTGGCALAIVALYHVDHARGRNRYTETIADLADYLRFTQDATGLVRSKYLLEKERFSSWQSAYYPGEALFALALAQRLAPAAATRTAMARLATRLAANWWRETTAGGDAPRQFDHWGLIGLNACEPLITDRDLHEQSPGDAAWTRERLLAVAVRYADDEWRRQVTAPGVDRGSFAGHPGASTPTAIRLEGMLAIRTCMRRQGADLMARFDRRFAHWPAAIDRGRRLLQRCQYAPDTPPAPGGIDLDGGVRRHVTAAPPCGGEVRIDYCQHAISAWLGPAPAPADAAGK